MLVNNVDITAYKAELLDRAISTTVVHSITDWMDEATEGSLLRQSYDWRNIKLTFLIREVDEDKAYKRISALTDALKKCTLRFDDIELDFPCVLDGSTVPDRLQNGVFKLVVNLKNDWALGEVKSFEYNVAAANAKQIHVTFIRNWTPVMESYAVCFDENEKNEQLGTEDFYIDLSLVEELANANTSWAEFFLALGVPVNKYKRVFDLNGFLDITDEYSPAKAKEILNERDSFIVYYNRFHLDGYEDLPGPKNYPSLAWHAPKTNNYYFDTGIGKGWDIQDITVTAIGRWFDITGGGCMFGTKNQSFSLSKSAENAYYAVGKDNPYFQAVFNVESAGQGGSGIIIGTLEDIANVPLREYAIKSSNEGASPVKGFADLVFNGITLTRVESGSVVLTNNLCIGMGYLQNEEENGVVTCAEIARVRIYHNGELVADFIPIAGNLKNGFINDYDVGFYDTIAMKYVGWTNEAGTTGRTPEGDLMKIPGMPDTPTPPPPVKTYTLTVVNGTGSGNYEEGALVSIVANSPSDNTQEFDKWVITSGNVTLNSPETSATNSFTMPAEAVTITATYKNKDPWESVEPQWFVYNNLAKLQAETSANPGANASSWDDEPTAGIEFIVAFSKPGVSGVTFYPSGTSGKTLKKINQGTHDGRFYVTLKSNSTVAFSGCDIQGVYEGQTIIQEFSVHSLF